MRPAWEGYLADPFVLKTDHGYFAVGTDGPGNEILRSTSRAFPTLHSDDLKSWHPLGGALIPPQHMSGNHFWAPEICAANDRFYLYYSAGGEEGECQRLRVATAERPEGPYEDAGFELLPEEPFSIDASPFHDPATGDWWLFFAKDFLTAPRPGTGCAVVRLDSSQTRVMGEPTTVLTADADWQIYERDRFWYGQTWPAWHTVEGPCCVHRQGRYWLFFSGGLWKGKDYGIGVVVADRPEGPYHHLEGRIGPSILKPSPDLRGPGHNSIVQTPDGGDAIVFHAWNHAYEKRQLHIAPLVWGPSGPEVIDA